MAEFTFNLDQLKASVGKTQTKFETSLYSKTKDEDLTYTGDDYIVWDRTNAERLRRGLPSLTQLGYPRPPEDTTGTATDTPATGSAPTNTDGSAKTFAIKGPPGLTREQAFAIFKKQADTGSLVGFKPGETLSAATQAADGLAGAQALVAQAQSGVTGSLNVGSFTSSLSASGVDLATGRIPSVDAAFARGGVNGGAGAFNSVLGSVASGLGASGGALSGSLAGIAPGLTAAVGPAVTSVTRSLGGTAGSSQLGAALVGAAGIQGSVAVTSIQTINKTISGSTVTSPINTADFTKIAGGINPAGALAGLGPMSVPEVNGVLAQAKNLVNQAGSVLSNTKGLGSFGLDAGQLETAGYVKPGTKALLAAGTNVFADVIKSPAVWTGKDGIKSAADLLKNVPKQSQIQQDLMAKGVAGLAAVGVPVKNLSSQGLAGMALNAAKDLPSAEAFAKGLPIPGDATGSVQAAFSSAVRDGAFAVNLVQTKIPAEFKQQDIPIPAANTVNRATVDAASTRVIGNDKVPTPNYGPTETKIENQADAEDYADKALIYINQYLNPAGRALFQIDAKLSALENQQTISPDTFSAIDSEYQQVRTTFNSSARVEAGVQYLEAFNKLTQIQRGNVNQLPTGPKNVQAKQALLIDSSNKIRQRLNKLELKIEGRGEGE
jgi:hypothetical protein